MVAVSKRHDTHHLFINNQRSNLLQDKIRHIQLYWPAFCDGSAFKNNSIPTSWRSIDLRDKYFDLPFRWARLSQDSASSSLTPNLFDSGFRLSAPYGCNTETPDSSMWLTNLYITYGWQCAGATAEIRSVALEYYIPQQIEAASFVESGKATAKLQ